MKTKFMFLTALLTALLLVGCSLSSAIPNARSITPSDNIVTEERSVSGFSGIDMRTIGKVILTQGDDEALVIKGSDNLLPLVKTTVQNDVLILEMEKNINIQSMDAEELLTFEITLKDLDNLIVSGLGTVEMDSLTTQSLKLVMSGAGSLSFDELAVEDMDITVSGLGNMTLAGKANSIDLVISGAGEVNAEDLEARSAYLRIPGLGTATVWVTETLTGEISGSGNVRYYGDPKTTTTTTGLGNFEALGSK